MREISLHILDIVQNSVVAGATRVEIAVTADSAKDLLHLCISDNGKGMTPDMIAKVMDPFVTTRTTRKVGLGLPMLAAAADSCGGDVHITSKPGAGTQVEASFKLSHIDRAPFGDITSTMVNAIVANPEVSFRYEQVVDGRSFFVDMAEVRRALGEEVPVEAAPVVKWLREYFQQGLNQVGVVF